MTGGSGLLGRAMIEDIKTSDGHPINLDLQPHGSEDTFYQVDATDQAAIEEAFKKIKVTFGRIDGLVNNAYPRTKDWGTDFEEDVHLKSWRANVDLQLNSYVACCQAIIPYFKEQQNGSIVNIASIYGVVGNDFTIYEGTNLKTAAPYSAIKGGLINFSRYLASRLGPFNIRVNCVSPGGIFDHQPEIFVKNYEHKVPMKRMGTPDDIAPPVTFLLSDGAKYITGQNLLVDGGWTCI